MPQKNENHQPMKNQWPVMQITQIEFKKSTGDKWAKGLQRAWNTSMYMMQGYLGGKIFRCCQKPDKFIIYTEWDSHKNLNNYMLKEEYKWYRITDTDDDVIAVNYETYEVDQDCCDPEVMISLQEWKEHLKKMGFPSNEPYYRKDRLTTGEGLPKSKKAHTPK